MWKSLYLSGVRGIANCTSRSNFAKFEQCEKSPKYLSHQEYIHSVKF